MLFCVALVFGAPSLAVVFALGLLDLSLIIFLSILFLLSAPPTVLLSVSLMNHWRDPLAYLHHTGSSFGTYCGFILGAFSIFFDASTSQKILFVIVTILFGTLAGHWTAEMTIKRLGRCQD
jgi:hypothetical protein